MHPAQAQFKRIKVFDFGKAQRFRPQLLHNPLCGGREVASMHNAKSR
ncbi:Uncharacterised protein [Vibrio cholerae]|nr:Uncharacterised protein [Vibrio cholerae]